MGTSLHSHSIFYQKQKTFFKYPRASKSCFLHINENAKEKDIWLDCVSGFSDHAHCLISLGQEQTISKVAQLIKGESSFCTNKNLPTEKFVWHDDYWAVGVSERYLESVRSYIHNQETHHCRKTFNAEIKRFIDKYGWELLKNPIETLKRIN